MSKTLTLTLTGPEAVVDQLLPLYARAHGWTPSAPLTAAEFARDVLARHFRSVVADQSSRDAQAAADAAARSAAGAAADTLVLALS